MSKIAYRNYRNLNDGKIYPHKNVNVIYGENAQGKTNLLEAVWLFTGGRSFRGSKDCDIVKFGNDFTSIDGDLADSQRDLNIKIFIEKGKRTAKINDVERGNAARIVGNFKSVIFSPSHLSLVKEGPENRRKLLDSVICQLKPTYPSVLSRYNHTLKQRNALLKSCFNNNILDTLYVWDRKLVEYGSFIIKERMNLLDILNGKARDIYRGISSEREDLELRYRSSIIAEKFMDANSIANLFMRALKAKEKADFDLGSTSLGPHRDDFDILINGKSAKHFGSQGQQRSCVLAIKLAEAGVMEDISNEKPVILLDDVMSELDVSRQNYMMNKIGDWQVFITCCDLSVVDRLKVGKVFRVQDGVVEEE